jgi:hypothetical protein
MMKVKSTNSWCRVAVAAVALTSQILGQSATAVVRAFMITGKVGSTG